MMKYIFTIGLIISVILGFTQNISYTHFKSIETDTCLSCNYVTEIKYDKDSSVETIKQYEKSKLVKKLKSTINNEFEVYSYEYDSLGNLVFEKKYSTIFGCLYKAKYFRYGDSVVRVVKSSKNNLYEESTFKFDSSKRIINETYLIDNKEVDGFEYSYEVRPQIISFTKSRITGNTKHISMSFYLDSSSYTSFEYGYIENGEIDYIVFTKYDSLFHVQKRIISFEQLGSEILLEKRDCIFYNEKKEEENYFLVFGDLTKDIFKIKFKKTLKPSNNILLNTNSCER
jgi:hypothetical protein